MGVVLSSLMWCWEPLIIFMVNIIYVEDEPFPFQKKVKLITCIKIFWKLNKIVLENYDDDGQFYLIFFKSCFKNFETIKREKTADDTIYIWSVGWLQIFNAGLLKLLSSIENQFI